MERHSVPTSEKPTVNIEVMGNAQVKGSDELEVSVKCETEELKLETQQDAVTVHCSGDCKIRVPRQATVVVEAFHGNGIVKAMEGSVKINSAKGNLVLRSTGPVELENVEGNLEARNVMGDFKAQKVAGNAAIRDIQGAFKAEDIRGNLVIADVDGAIETACRGNIILNLDPTSGDEYHLKADGDLVCSLPSDASVVIEVERASKVVTSLPTASGETPTTAPCSLTMGEGDAKLHLSAGGDVVLSGQMPNFEPVSGMNFDFSHGFDSIGEQISQQVEAQMQKMEEQLDNLSVNIGSIGLPPDQVARIQQRARENSERAATRAQEKMRRASEKLERKMAFAQQRAEQKAKAHGERRSWNFSWPGVSQPASVPAVPQEPISEDERLAVLHMLEQKKITPEEAEMLLSALEGKEG